MKGLMIAAVIFAGSAAASATEMERLKAGAEIGALSREAITQSGAVMIPAIRHHSVNTYFKQDCEKVIFTPHSSFISERVRLYSEECTEVCGDDHGNHYPCHTTCGGGWRRTAQIEIAPRKLLAWETESFRVCLKGPETRLYLDRPAYGYEVSRTGDYDITYRLKPLDKIATEPDENGLKLAEFACDAGSGGFRMTIADIWAEDYAGEKVAIRAELRKDIPYWPDQSLGEKEFYLDAAPEYKLTILPQGAAGIDGGKYFVKWGFRRIGRVSRDTFVEKGETFRVEAAK